MTRLTIGELCMLVIAGCLLVALIWGWNLTG